jgi:hypothetical protein
MAEAIDLIGDNTKTRFIKINSLVIEGKKKIIRTSIKTVPFCDSPLQNTAG